MNQVHIFEKGNNPTRTFEAIQHAAALMAKYAGREALEGGAEAKNLQVQERTVSVTAEKVNRVLGTNISASENGYNVHKLKIPIHRSRRNIPCECTSTSS